MDAQATAHQLDPLFPLLTLLFVALVIGEIRVLALRRWSGVTLPDYIGWDPERIVVDKRFHFVLGLVLSLAWASIAVAFVREALRQGIGAQLPSYLGPVPLPPWAALVLQEGHGLGLFYALWATGLWLDWSVAKNSARPSRLPGGEHMLPLALAVMAIAVSTLF